MVGLERSKQLKNQALTVDVLFCYFLHLACHLMDPESNIKGYKNQDKAYRAKAHAKSGKTPVIKFDKYSTSPKLQPHDI